MVPQFDLKRQYSAIREEVLTAVSRAFDSAEFVLGKEVAAFEAEFAAFCSSPFGVAVNTGTSALHLALLASGIGPGDEVITVPLTFVATVAAIQYAGATPVLVDVDPVTYTMNPSQLKAALTPKTKAIIPVHLYGHPADMQPILDFAGQHGLTVIEDAAQAHGAEYHGRRCGSMGDVGCFSFYPGKNLGAYGEGGLVTTRHPEIARKTRMLRDWGAEKRYEHVMKGFNYRMDGVQGAILRVKLRYLDQWTDARRAHAAAYRATLSDSGVVLPTEAANCRHVYHIFPVLTEARADFLASLNASGVQAGIHYPRPVHLLPAYQDLNYSAGEFPVAEQVAAQEVSLPMFPELEQTEIEQVIKAVTEFHTVTA